MILIYCDNVSSIRLVKNLVFHAWPKDIEVHYHFVHERVLSGEVELRYVQTDQKVADIFTKSFGLDKFHHFFEILGLKHFDVPHLSAIIEKGNKYLHQTRCRGGKN